MAPDSGRHRSADGPADDPGDRVRIDYLAGDIDLSVDPGALDQAELDELDELRALLADPNLWAEPPASLEESVVAAIAAEAAALPPPAEPEQAVRARPAEAASADSGADRAGTGPAAPDGAADLAAARRRREQRSGRSRWTRPTLLVAAAAAVIVLAAGTILTLRPSGDRTFTAALAGTELAPNASGSVVMLRTDSGWEIKLTATGLPRLDNGRFYQGWLRNADGVLVPIGTFNEGTDVVLWAGVSPESFPTLTVTEEDADGNQASSGRRVLVGTAVEEK